MAPTPHLVSRLLRLDSAGAHINESKSSKHSVFTKQTNCNIRQVVFSSFLTLYFQKFMTGYFTPAGTSVQNGNKNSNARFGVSSKKKPNKTLLVKHSQIRLYAMPPKLFSLDKKK